MGSVAICWIFAAAPTILSHAVWTFSGASYGIVIEDASGSSEGWGEPSRLQYPLIILLPHRFRERTPPKAKGES